jgi:hypothetical protein
MRKPRLGENGAFWEAGIGGIACFDCLSSDFAKGSKQQRRRAEYIRPAALP